MKKQFSCEDVLVRRAQAGDADAFEALLLSTQNMVYRLALRLSRNEEDALDISQEAYLHAWRAIGAFKSKCSFSTWIYTLTRNAAIDYLKKQGRTVPTVSLDAEDEEGNPVSVPLAAADADPADLVVRAERSGEIREAIDRLPPQQREVLLLCDAEGFSYTEIASALGIEEGTVKSRLHRAREKLRKNLPADGTFSDRRPSYPSEKQTETSGETS